MSVNQKMGRDFWKQRWESFNDLYSLKKDQENLYSLLDEVECETGIQLSEADIKACSEALEERIKELESRFVKKVAKMTPEEVANRKRGIA